MNPREHPSEAFEEASATYNRRGDFSDLGFGVCATAFILFCVTALVLWHRRRKDVLVREKAVTEREEALVAKVIDAVVVETTASTALTHRVDSTGKKVCRFCHGYSPTWYRPRMLVLDEGILGWERERRRLPPRWVVRTLENEAQDVCSRHHLIETQRLAKEAEERHQLYEKTTEEVMRRHERFTQDFHASLSDERSRDYLVQTW